MQQVILEKTMLSIYLSHCLKIFYDAKEKDVRQPNDYLRMSSDEIVKSLFEEASDYVRGKRKCKEITDLDFAQLNILRVLLEGSSGRSFLQKLDEVADTEAKRATYFDALNSKRRRDYFCALALALEKVLEGALNAKGVDYLEQFPELNGRHIFAADGHTIKHACHATRDAKGRNIPSESVFMLDLRLGLVRSVAPVSGPSKKGHDWRAMKEAFPQMRESLGQTSKSPILIYDRACPDLQFASEQILTTELKTEFIIREKANMLPTIQQPLTFNKSLEVNTGVTAVYTVGFNNTITMRKVCYTNPEDERSYTYLTTNQDLEPGVIAWLYFLRWRIEKVFDLFKNRYCEKKSWATTQHAQVIQSTSAAAAHNILMFMKHILDIDFDIREGKLEKKRKATLKQREKVAEENGRQIHPLTYTHPIMQLSAQFIREVEKSFRSGRPWRGLLPKFRKAMSTVDNTLKVYQRRHK
jgi:hypothetical protein